MTLEQTLAAPEGIADVARVVGADGVRRIVATGNGAAFYAAMALWLASLEGPTGPDVLAIPAGLMARGAFSWRAGDVLLAFSSSGEMRDVIEALDAGAPTPFAAVTASPESTIGSRASAVASVAVASQEAVTHTQAFCGNVVAALSIWALVTGDSTLDAAVRGVPELAAAAVERATTWAVELPEIRPEAGMVFGSNHAWAGALEGALLLKEVAGLPAEGVETREGATSAMYPLRPCHLVVSLPTVGDTWLLEEAERICGARGATVLRAPGGDLSDPRLNAVATFPAMVALAARLGLERGLDVDAPAWTDAYYAVARGPG
jgi:fructoselysine-6-P-deglycase FrlB-like protein